MGIPVIQVQGIGPKSAEYLSQQGITTVSDFIAAGAGVLAAAPGFSQSRAEQVYAAAIAMGGRVSAPVSDTKPAEKRKEKKASKRQSDKKSDNKKSKSKSKNKSKKKNKGKADKKGDKGGSKKRAAKAKKPAKRSKGAANKKKGKKK